MDTQIGSFVFSKVVTILMEVVGLHHLLVMADRMDQVVGEALAQSLSHFHHVPLQLLALDLLLDLTLVDGLGVSTERDHHFDLVLCQNIKPVGSSTSVVLLPCQPVEKENTFLVIKGTDGPIIEVTFCLLKSISTFFTA